jgi:hypothetical protein
LKRGPVLGFQLDDGDPVGFGSAEVIVSPGFDLLPGVVAPGGEGANDSGLVQFLDNAGVGLGFIGSGRLILLVPFLARAKEAAKHQANKNAATTGELVIVVIAGKGKDAASTGQPGHPREVRSFLHLIQ